MSTPQKLTRCLACTAPAIRTSRLGAMISLRAYSDSQSNSKRKMDDQMDSIAKPAETIKPAVEIQPKQKTQAELDKDLLIKLQGLDGDGGAAGVEYEDGKPVSMKRSVKNNMFRYI